MVLIALPVLNLTCISSRHKLPLLCSALRKKDDDRHEDGRQIRAGFGLTT